MINLRSLPKVELHVHLDGSIRPLTASELLSRDVKELEYQMVAKEKCNNLSDYLTKFDIPTEILQTKYTLERAAYELTVDMKNESVIYAEIRFAPLKHIKDGLTLIDVMGSVFRGLNRLDIKTNVILCLMRGDSFEDNKMVIDLAKEYLNKGVCALDLAGAEEIYKTSDYEELFRYAKELDIPFTIHAGEADGLDSIKAALDFGAKRIGHGIRAIEDEIVLNRIKNDRILLEVCPTSNIQTGVVDSYKNHPIKKLYDMGICISINTDNRTVSNTTLTKEYTYLYNDLGFSREDFIKINKDSIQHAFISDEEKNKLLSKLNSLI